jgi:hypothetical protein
VRGGEGGRERQSSKLPPSAIRRGGGRGGWRFGPSELGIYGVNSAPCASLIGRQRRRLHDRGRGQVCFRSVPIAAAAHWRRQSLVRRAPARNSHRPPQLIGCKLAGSLLYPTPIVKLEAIEEKSVFPFRGLPCHASSCLRRPPPFAFWAKLFVNQAWREIGNSECRHFPDQPPIFAQALRPHTGPE